MWIGQQSQILKFYQKNKKWIWNQHRFIKSTLESFTEVNRRFTTVGSIESALVIDNYAHHPTEKKGFAVRWTPEDCWKIIIIHQSHRFTRLNTLFSDFCSRFGQADKIIITPLCIIGRMTSKARQLQLMREQGKWRYVCSKRIARNTARDV
jgi:UDP-N-acetylmuramate-alanine ligase